MDSEEYRDYMLGKKYAEEVGHRLSGNTKHYYRGFDEKKSAMRMAARLRAGK